MKVWFNYSWETYSG